MDTTVAAERTVSLGPHEVFALFGTSEGAGWLFGARCDSPVLGAAVSMRLPVHHPDGRHGVDILGRLSRVVPGSLLEIEHTQPWRGRLSVRLMPAQPSGTRVRIRANVSNEGVKWLLHRGGIPLPEPPDDGAVRIGALTNASGPGAVYSMSSELMAELAVSEVNADGGIGGRPVQLVSADDGTDPEQAVSEALRMVRLGCRAIFVNTTSACFEAVRAAVGSRDVLLLHTVMNEGGSATPTSIRLGERPAAQTEALVRPMMKEAGARRWFFVGQSYVWSHGAHAMARRTVARANGDVVGEELVPLGSTDFTRVIEQIAASGAELVLSSLVGADEVAFERQVADAGLRYSTRTLSLSLEEATLAHIGPHSALGVRTALSYLQDNPVEGNTALLSRYRAAHGVWAPPITTFSETVYEAIHRYARVVHDVPEGSATQHGREMSRRRRHRGVDVVGARDLVAPTLYTAQVGRAGLQIVGSVEGLA